MKAIQKHTPTLKCTQAINNIILWILKPDGLIMKTQNHGLQVSLKLRDGD